MIDQVYSQNSTCFDWGVGVGFGHNRVFSLRLPSLPHFQRSENLVESPNPGKDWPGSFALGCAHGDRGLAKPREPRDFFSAVALGDLTACYGQ